jgi:hypothetical protein
MNELLSPITSTSPDGSLERLVLAPLAAYSAERMEAAAEGDKNSNTDAAAVDTGYATMSRTMRGGESSEKRHSILSVDSAKSSIAEVGDLLCPVDCC